ncbi:MAG: zinc-binding dehydrogenase [Actinomycetota bacterium]
MRVARLTGIGAIRVFDEPMPHVAAGCSLVRVSTVGLCGSDLHWYVDGGIGDAKLDHPMVLGHEFSGVIEGGPRGGERVAVDPAIPCEQCEICREGHRNLCPDILFAGHGETDGGLRDFVVWPDRHLVRLPDSISADVGAVLEPLGVAIHAVDLGHVPLGGTVAVVGCGPIGLLLIQVARAAGAAVVVAVEPLEHRRAAAVRAGADVVLDAADDRADLRAALPRRGADVVFEAAGPAAAVETAMYAARPGGRVVLAGIPDDDRTAFSASVARRKGLTIAVARRMKEVYPRAIALVQRGLVDAGSLVTHGYPLDNVEEAFGTAAGRGGLKVVVRPSVAEPLQ